MDSDSARSAAEARRLRILNRGKERLTKITMEPMSSLSSSAPSQEGVCPLVEQRPHSPVVAVQAGGSGASAGTSVHAAPCQDPVDLTTAASGLAFFPPEPLCASSAPHLRHSSRSGRAVPSDSRCLQAASTSETLPVAPSSTAASTTGVTPPSPALRQAVQRTRLVRLILAAWLAQAMVMGTMHPALMAAPPVLMLLAIQVSQTHHFMHRI